MPYHTAVHFSYSEVYHDSTSIRKKTLQGHSRSKVHGKPLPSDPTDLTLFESRTLSVLCLCAGGVSNSENKRFLRFNMHN